MSTQNGGYDNELRGSLFKNKDKKTDKHPEYQGKCQIKGEEFYVSAWVKTSKAGEKYMSLSFKSKNAPNEQNKPYSEGNKPLQEPQQPAPIFNDVDDDLPF